jgi:hypothetical protein
MKIIKFIVKEGFFPESIRLISMILMPLVLLLGCGGGGGGGGVARSSSSSGSTSQYSITDCYNCHADGLIAKYASENIFSSWRNGPHGNYEGTSYTGYPAYIDLTSGCLTCHDERGDGELLYSYYLSSGSSFLGTVNRPLVGCESCHGTGDSHFGIGPIPYPDPDAGICGNCHNTNTHLTGSPQKLESGSIYSSYTTSPHAGSIKAAHYAAGSTTDVKARCSKCHTDEGAKLYKDVTGGYATLVAALPDSLAPVANATVVQCRTCHDAHDPGKLLKPAGSGTSSEYETCTNCHQTADGYHGENSSYSWSGGSVGSGTLDTSEIIYDSHFDDETTTDIEGYNIDESSDRSCRGCHNQHNVDTTINEEWANSSHGGLILTTTQDAVTHKYKVTETEGPAFVHYDFKGTSRQACQRCHTATGFKNLADNPATYDPANNDFSYLSGEQREMLYCWACHSSNAGDLRDPGAFAIVAPYTAPASRINAVPDLNGSNLCMSCHSGRLNGQYIKDYGTISGKNFGTFNSHYLADGGILFRTIGYEFTGLDYSNVTGFAHASIGTTGGTDGDQGPCVGCHMLTDDDHPNHELEPVEKDGTGLATDIKVFTKVCSGCHSEGKATLISTLNTRETQYSAALDALQTQLQNNGLYYGSAHPYFYSDAGLTTAYTAWPDKDTLGAAFNFNLLMNIPAAYAHNSQYTRKLIYDSIDFLDDGTLNRSVEASLGGSGDAYDYLNGTR